MNIVPLTPLSISQAAQTLFTAFQNDPVLLWLFGGEENYQQKALPAFKTWVKWCAHYGMGFTIGNFQAVILWKKPNKHHFHFFDLLRAGMLTASYVYDADIRARIFLLDKLIENEYSKHIVPQKFWYCWIFGTAPAFQHQGHGKILMNHCLEITKSSNLPICLETGNESNVHLYQKLNFEIISQVPLSQSPIQLTFMAKNLTQT